MTTLSKKIDFAVIVTVQHANPNGDPLNGNRPRVTYEGFGEMSDVSIKRKIRNRLQEMGNKIFVQSDDNRVDDYGSLRERTEGTLKGVNMSDKKKFQEAACKAWLDVRAFGQVFAFKAKKGKKSEGEEDSEGVSIPVRGPVSIHPAFSVAPVLDRSASIQITKSVSGEPSEKRGSDTMGMKHRVDHGVYVFYGSMNPQLASKTGFSDEDAQAIKEALRTLFVNDASSARPEGSMAVHKVYWWEHNSSNGQTSSANAHNAVRSQVGLRDGVIEPQGIEDYNIPTKDDVDRQLEKFGLKCEVIDGE
ncbi:MAG: type I-C CRISPR-associated protein Cas7/Csd2 [Chloroflexi bacterium]|nr:type I-C CRISPR-associated protein Cas7/Csd2 [Chloroflexota bacterium]MDL1941597.1 type I-C CRISPR-associated protein Cas7/Csd2 [Chloroflexi bacterium CFX2]